MNLIREGTDFSKKDNMHFVSFVLKCVALSIPAIILGYDIDKRVEKWKNKSVLGDNLGIYIFTQTAIIIVTIYLLYLISSNYTAEFQNTFPGLLFGFLFFGMQTNYIVNLQKMLETF